MGEKERKMEMERKKERERKRERGRTNTYKVENYAPSSICRVCGHRTSHRVTHVNWRS